MWHSCLQRPCQPKLEPVDSRNFLARLRESFWPGLSSPRCTPPRPQPQQSCVRKLESENWNPDKTDFPAWKIGQNKLAPAQRLGARPNGAKFAHSASARTYFVHHLCISYGHRSSAVSKASSFELCIFITDHGKCKSPGIRVASNNLFGRRIWSGGIYGKLPSSALHLAQMP